MRHTALLIALVTTLLAPNFQMEARPMGNSASSEYLVKAGFIYNFAKLVQWPDAAFVRPDSPIIIGVLDNEQFAAVLSQVVSGKKIDSRPFVVKTLDWGNDLKQCNILFISSESRRSVDAVELLQGTSVLTIAETPGSAKRGVIINFVLENSKVQFEVNLDAANKASLSISSRLLSLAKIVQGRIF